MELARWSLRTVDVPPVDVRMRRPSCREMHCQTCAPGAAFGIGRDMSLMYASSIVKWLNVGWSHVGHTMVECELNFYSQGVGDQ